MMIVLIKIISVTTYSFSIAIVIKPWISDAIISPNRKHELFRHYKNGIVTFDVYNYYLK